ncbi:MAG: sugar nucleotide-binding protein [Bacilli bacterium]
MKLESRQKTEVENGRNKCPLSAERLAEMIVEICERPNLSGIYHYAGLEPVSRYDMGARIAKYFGLNPAEFIEPVQGDRPMNLTMDMSCLAAHKEPIVHVRRTPPRNESASGFGSMAKV